MKIKNTINEALDIVRGPEYVQRQELGKRIKELEYEIEILSEALSQVEHHVTANKIWGGTDGYILQGINSVRQQKIIDLINKSRDKQMEIYIK